MGSIDRSKKRIQLWKKAILQFSLCFVMGFFSGFAPSNTASILSGQLVSYQPVDNLDVSPESIENTTELTTLNRSLMSESVPESSAASLSIEKPESESEPNSVRALIIITTTRSNDPLQKAFLGRMAQTLRLVEPPLLWVVVEAISNAPRTAESLRKTGIMYRHLTFRENFTDPRAEADHQRNVALNHIEHHRLDGIVHFADLNNVYDLQFFEEIREIEVFGTWPVAMLSASRKRVLVDGPACSSSQVMGWQTKDISSGNTTIYSGVQEVNTDTNNGITESTAPPAIHTSGFAFNSSILWDPERWGRSSAAPDNSQDSIKFVREVVLEDVSKLRAIPQDCSRIMLWNLYIPRNFTCYQSQRARR